jgi:hypothetical protein
MHDKLVNLTPHNIDLLDVEDNIILSIAPSGIVARVEMAPRTRVGVVVTDVTDIPINRTSFGRCTSLPEPISGTYYIVSLKVAEAHLGRTDLLIVDESVRDVDGRIIGCRAFARI